MASVLANANFSPASANAPKDVSSIREGENLGDYRERLLDEILEKAEKIPNNLQRDIFIAQGVLRSSPKQFEKARDIAEKIEDKNLSEQIINVLIYGKSLDLIKLGSLSEAYKLLQKNSNLIQRASILIIGAQKLSGKKESFQAREWFSEGRKLFEKNKFDDADWINIGFAIASGYSEFDKFEAIGILRESAKLIEIESSNYNQDKAPLSVGFSGLDFADFTIGTKGFSLNSAIKIFPKENFEDTLSILKEIKNQKAKSTGILTLAKNNLKFIPK